MTKACQSKRHSALNGITALAGLINQLTSTLTRHECPHCRKTATLVYKCPKCLKTSNIFKVTPKEARNFKAYAKAIETCDALVVEENGPIIKKEETNNES